MSRLDTMRAQLAALETQHEAERGELIELTAADELDDTGEARYAELDARFDDTGRWADETQADELRSTIAKMEAIEAIVAAAREPAQAPPERRGVMFSVDAGRDDIWGRSIRSSGDGEVREVAMRAIERRLVDDDERHAVDRLIARIHDPEKKLLRHIVNASRPEYERAFAKLVNGAAHLLTDGERAAVAEMSTRGMSLTDGQGGYGVPFILDTTLIDTGTHYMGPWREVFPVIQTTADNWQGLASTGVTASMTGEAVEATDGSPTFTQPSITPKKAAIFVKMTIEIDQDFDGNLGALVRQQADIAKDDLEDAQFAVGSGAGNNVQGLITGLVAASVTTASATTDVFAVADLYAVEEALQQRARQRAVWIGNKAIYNDIRQFGTSDSHALWVRLMDGLPERLLGYPHYESPNMDGVINASAENYVLAIVDPGAYRIIDRVGMTVTEIPVLFGATNNFPTGEKGLYFNWRYGAGVVNSAVGRVLNVT